MAQTLKIDNFTSLNIIQQFSLDADASSGSTTLTLKDTSTLASGDFVILGQLGQDGSELVTIQGVTNSTTVTLAGPTTIIHQRYELATKLFGNQIQVFRAANISGELPDDATFSSLSTFSINADSLSTTYTDPAGGSGYWYKFVYFNSTSASGTQLADSGATRGGGYGHYVSIEDIRKEAGMENNRNISDSIIDSRRIDAEQEINSELYEIYTLPFGVPVPALISQVNRMIAAGLVLIKEYGTMSTGSSKDGEAKISDGRDLLMRIKSRELTLLDPAGQSLLQQPTVTSWPNASTDQSGSGVSYSDVIAGDLDFGPAVHKAMRF